jgi:hypothetical protein
MNPAKAPARRRGFCFADANNQLASTSGEDWKKGTTSRAVQKLRG